MLVAIANVKFLSNETVMVMGNNVCEIIKGDEVKEKIDVYVVKEVVEEIDPERAGEQILLEEALTHSKRASVGNSVKIKLNPKNFGRIAAQTAKQVLLQKLREIEHANTVNEFEDKEGELMACTVRRIEDGNVYVEIGGNQIEGVILPRDQVPGEKYELNQRLNVYVKHVVPFSHSSFTKKLIKINTCRVNNYVN